jgi:hypothetical protein
MPLLTVADSIKTSFLTSDDNVSDHLAVLPTLWRQFDSSVAIQHLQESVRVVSDKRHLHVIPISTSDEAHKRESFVLSSSKIVLYGVPKA